MFWIQPVVKAANVLSKLLEILRSEKVSKLLGLVKFGVNTKRIIRRQNCKEAISPIKQDGWGGFGKIRFGHVIIFNENIITVHSSLFILVILF